jgi:hypothetical protein
VNTIEKWQVGEKCSNEDKSRNNLSRKEAYTLNLIGCLIYFHARKPIISNTESWNRFYVCSHFLSRELPIYEVTWVIARNFENDP